jgi:hypothetical protein
MIQRTYYTGASVAAAALLLVGLLGCDSSKTETGYTPRRLGMNAGEIHALYAPAFSPEAHAADSEKKMDSQVHRPQY